MDINLVTEAKKKVDSREFSDLMNSLLRSYLEVPESPEEMNLKELSLKIREAKANVLKEKACLADLERQHHASLRKFSGSKVQLFNIEGGELIERPL